jgi:glutamyl-Q tRNA(Asp) synthetase
LAQAGPALVAALEFLGQVPPAGLARAGVREIWDWALANWSFAGIPRQATRHVAGFEDAP